MIISEVIVGLMIRGAGPRAGWSALGCTLAAAAPLAGQVPKQAAAPPVAVPGSAVPALARGLVDDSRRLGEAVRLELGKGPQGQQLTARANTLLGAAEHLERTVKLRDSNPQRREAARDLRRAYQPLAAALRQPAINAPGARRIAERVGLKLGSLEEAMQIPREPETPVEVRLQRALIREYTGMIAEVDTFMTGLNDKVPEGLQIRTEALALRDATRRLRRFTAQGAPDGQIVQELNAAVNAQRTVAARVERVNQGRQPGPNVLRLRRIGETLARIQAAATAGPP